MNIEGFIAELEMGIEGLTRDSLRPETVLRELSVWDSLAVLATLACVDACFGVQINASELQECRTVRDVFERASGKKM